MLGQKGKHGSRASRTSGSKRYFKWALLFTIFAAVVLYGVFLTSVEGPSLQAGVTAFAAKTEFVRSRKHGVPNPRPPHPPPPSPSPPEAPVDSPLRHFPFQGPEYKLYSVDEPDRSRRCQNSGICDGNYTCGSDGLGCITDSKERRKKIVEAARWSWMGYRSVHAFLQAFPAAIMQAVCSYTSCDPADVALGHVFIHLFASVQTREPSAC